MPDLQGRSGGDQRQIDGMRAVNFPIDKMWLLAAAELAGAAGRRAVLVAGGGGRGRVLDRLFHRCPRLSVARPDNTGQGARAGRCSAAGRNRQPCTSNRHLPDAGSVSNLELTETFQTLAMTGDLVTTCSRHGQRNNPHNRAALLVYGLASRLFGLAPLAADR